MRCCDQGGIRKRPREESSEDTEAVLLGLDADEAPRKRTRTGWADCQWIMVFNQRKPLKQRCDCEFAEDLLVKPQESLQEIHIPSPGIIALAHSWSEHDVHGNARFLTMKMITIGLQIPARYHACD